MVQYCRQGLRASLFVLLSLLFCCAANAQQSAPVESEAAPQLITVIYVSKADNMLRACAGENVLLTFPVATGRNNCTPVGTFSIISKSTRPGSPVFGPRWMALNKIGNSGRRYGIHGTNDPSSIGKHRSAGCIRLYNADIITLYDMTPVGTQVIIMNESLPAVPDGQVETDTPQANEESVQHGPME